MFFLFFCQFSKIFKSTFFTDHLRETISVFHWRMKNMLFNLSWKEQRRYDIVMFLLEMFVQPVVLEFFSPKKIRCKTHKKHIKCFIIDEGFILCLTSTRLTHSGLIRVLFGYSDWRCP